MDEYGKDEYSTRDMTMSETMNGILGRIRERLADAKTSSAESHKVAMNSYGAGYDAGVVEALKDSIEEITGERPD